MANDLIRVFEAVRTPLAALTDVVYWPAWEALGTVGVVWFAVRESFSTARVQRERAIAAVQGLFHITEALLEECVPYQGILPDDVDGPRVATRLIKEGTFEWARQNLDAYRLADVPSGEALRILINARRISRALIGDLEQIAGGRYPDFDRWVLELRSCVQEFKNEAVRLSGKRRIPAYEWRPIVARARTGSI